MSLPTPKPGLVIRYGFLWSSERAKGAENAGKDRPCAIVVATATEATGEIRVIVAPITHAPPADPDASVAIPRDIARSLGLDDHPQWIRADELNRFAWPGFDLRPLPGQPGRFAYGMLPRDLFEALRQRILDRQRRLRGRIIPRD